MLARLTPKLIASILISVAVTAGVALLVIHLTSKKSVASGTVGTINTEDCLKLNGNIGLVAGVRQCQVSSVVFNVID